MSHGDKDGGSRTSRTSRTDAGQFHGSEDAITDIGLAVDHLPLVVDPPATIRLVGGILDGDVAAGFHPMGDQSGVPAVANRDGQVEGGFVSNLAERDDVRPPELVEGICKFGFLSALPARAIS